jgi:multiple sugar transport system substrate-binding protein
MSAGAALHGMAWDHPRARDPLAAVSAAWSKERGAAVEWDARPLKDFEDQPLEDLATTYDLVLIDYPFVGAAASSNLIVPANEWTDARYLADQAAHSVGPSYGSYTWAGKQWALAIDAACQVSALREDLWNAAGLGPLPDTWAQVENLAQRLGNAPARVAVPLNPNHAYCAFLSIGVSMAGPQFWPVHGRFDRSAGCDALAFLQHLALHLHRTSEHDDPIAISDRMSRTDEIMYVPLMFGYSSYARPGFRPHRLRFGNAPKGPSGLRGSVLGGVGIALSARSAHRTQAADLARTIAAAEIQSGLYARAGGQPGHSAAWDCADVNAQTGDFFRATRATMEQAFVRPRVPGHRRFQPLAGELIHGLIWRRDRSAEACLKELERLVDSLLPDWRQSGVV